MMEINDTLSRPVMCELATKYTIEEKYDLALPLCEKIYKSLITENGVNHPDTLTAMSNYGVTLVNLERYSEGDPLLTQCLELRTKVLGRTNIDTLVTLNELCYLLCRSQNNNRAEPLLQEYIELASEVRGVNHSSVVDSKISLANLYTEENRFNDAHKLYEESLEPLRNIRGNTHADVTLCLSNLAFVERELGNFVGAEHLYKECLDIRLGSLGDNHVDTVIAQSNLANTYFNNRKYASAQPLFERTLEWHKTNSGLNNFETLSAFICLADTHYLQQNYPDAETLYVEYLRIAVPGVPVRENGQISILDLMSKLNMIPPEEIHNDMLNCLSCLGNIYYGIEQYYDARQLFQQCLLMSLRESGGSETELDDKTAPYVNDIADCYFAEGIYEEAESRYQSVWCTYCQYYGPLDDKSLLALTNIGNCNAKMQNHEKAVTTFNDLLAYRTNSYGETHEKTIVLKQKLASVYYNQGEFLQAVPILAEVVEVRKSKGPHTKEVAISIFNLANTLYSLGELREAASLFEECLEIRESLFGKEHPITIVTQKNHAAVLDMLNNACYSAPNIIATQDDDAENTNDGASVDHPLVEMEDDSTSSQITKEISSAPFPQEVGDSEAPHVLELSTIQLSTQATGTLTTPSRSRLPSSDSRSPFIRKSTPPDIPNYLPASATSGLSLKERLLSLKLRHVDSSKLPNGLHCNTAFQDEEDEEISDVKRKFARAKAFFESNSRASHRLSAKLDKPGLSPNKEPRPVSSPSRLGLAYKLKQLNLGYESASGATTAAATERTDYSSTTSPRADSAKIPTLALNIPLTNVTTEARKKTTDSGDPGSPRITGKKFLTPARNNIKDVVGQGIDATMSKTYASSADKQAALDDESFQKIFNMDKQKFNELKKWKQDELKKQKGFF